MNHNKLLIGISAAALAAATAAGSAAAQTQTGNCTAPAGSTSGISPGGTCTVDNRAVGNDDSSSFIFQSGEGNDADVVQQGDDNVSIVRQEGENNQVGHSQIGNDHYASTDQRGDENLSAVSQGDQDNSATVVQIGDSHFVSLVQGRKEFNDGNPEAGENNVASVTQDGTDLGADLSQAVATFGQGPADDNVMTVVMTGVRNSTRVHQLSRGNVARNSVSGGGVTAAGASVGNSSSILQNNPFYRLNGDGELEGGAGFGALPTPENNPFSGNVADAAVTGQQNTSSVSQGGVLNSATVSMLGGGAGNTGDTTADIPSNRGPSGAQLPANRKAGNASDIRQDGRGNVAAVSIGGLGGLGNISLIEQGSTTSDPATLGVDHTAFLWQRGVLDQSTIVQDNNSRGPSGTLQAASFADVSQRSLNSTSYLEQVGTNSATVSQGTGRDTGDNAVRVRQNDAGDVAAAADEGIFNNPGTAVTEAHNTAAVSQTGIGNALTIDQDARNATAIVWQQINSRGNTVEVEQGTGAQTTGQNSAQDNQPIGSAGGYLSGSVTGTGAAGSDNGFGALNLTADITQSGFGSDARIRQDGQNLSFLGTQGGTRTSGGVAADSNNTLLVSQVDSLNSATATQSGFNLSAEIDQRGSGLAAGATGNDNVTRRNLVTIQQTGDGHRAIARQLANVGPSAPDNPNTTVNEAPAAGDASQPAVFTFARPGGRQSAEITIIQTGSTSPGGSSTLDDTGNDAFVEQQGKGQFARIEQNGAGNDAGILQGPNATNAVAVIQQNGNGNRFFITQDSAGQYMHIRQTGNNNASTTEVSSAPTTGQTGGTGGPTNPGFFPFAPNP